MNELAPELRVVAEALRGGEIVAVPTDTVYGLAALAASPKGVAAIFALKARPERIALPVLVADLEQARALSEPDERLSRLGHRFWPGALTIVVRRRAGLELRLGGDEATIGLRCPNASTVRALARALGPLAVTSANRHGDEPCSSPEEVRASFGEALLLIAGGELHAPVSSVVSLVDGEPKMLRTGAVTLGAIRRCLEQEKGDHL